MADVPESRWYRLTPDRVVVAMLALEGFLLLSEHFRWFPFNEHKGYTLLICLAAVGAAFVLMFLWFLAAWVFRWRFQFSILALLLLTVVVAVPFSWLATEMKEARKQREAVERNQEGRGAGFLRLSSFLRLSRRSVRQSDTGLHATGASLVAKVAGR